MLLDRFVLLKGFWIIAVLAGIPASLAARAESDPPKTLITGERMSLIGKGEAVEFVGGVKLRRGNDFLSAHRMVSEEKKGLTRAYGRVYLRRDLPEEGVRWEAWADEAVYDSKASSGTLWGNKKTVRMKRTPLTGADPVLMEVTSDRATLFESTTAFPAAGHLSGGPEEAAPPSPGPFTYAESEGRVHLVYREPQPRETQVWASRAFYNGALGRVQFWGGYSGSGFPRALQTEAQDIRRLAGETMIYFVEDQRLQVQNNVQAVLERLNEKEGVK
jgi:lipopolysaccharide export system protein LptA